MSVRQPAGCHEAPGSLLQQRFLPGTICVVCYEFRYPSVDVYEKNEVRKKIPAYVKHELRTLPSHVEMVVSYSALGLECHVTSGRHDYWLRLRSFF